MQEAAVRCFSLIDVFPSLSLPSPLSKNNINIFLKIFTKDKKGYRRAWVPGGEGSEELFSASLLDSALEAAGAPTSPQQHIISREAECDPPLPSLYQASGCQLQGDPRK